MRLTKKDKIKELSTFQKHNVLMTNTDYKELKLGQLEDIEERQNMSIEEIDAYITEHKRIEEELGIELITLFKALKNGILFWKYNNKIMPSNERKIHFKEKYFYAYVDTMTYEIYYFKDYGKTWALTKEELEE